MFIQCDVNFVVFKYTTFCSQAILKGSFVISFQVGTGLGPTLEFYTLVSKEFQKSSMEMWRGSTVARPPTEGK